MNGFDSHFMPFKINYKQERNQESKYMFQTQFGTVVMKDFKKIFMFQDVFLSIKIRLIQAIVFTLIAYVSEN